MDGIFRCFCASKYSTATSEDGEEEERKSRNIGRCGHHKTSAVAASSQLLVHGRPLHESHEKVSNLQDELSSVAASHVAAVPHTAETKSISASSDQQAARMFTGATPEQLPQSGIRETSLHASALACSNAGQDGRIESVPPVLPPQLSEKGYQLISTEPVAKGAIQSVYSLTKKTTNSSDSSYFVVKFPRKAGRSVALKGVNIQEELASSHNGDQYFVPVVEKVMKNGELICHVEPEGVPVIDYLNANKLDLKQHLHLFSRMLEAIGAMHSREVVNLDIKASNMIVKRPVTAMRVRLCDFDFARRWSETDGRVVLPVGTYENMCPQVLDEMPYLPKMADLWAFILTVWKIMTCNSPFRHWLSGMLNSPERRDTVSLKFAKCFSLSGWGHVSERASLPDGQHVIADDLLERLCQDQKRGEKNRQRLQLFFWNNLVFPADIDRLRMSARKRCILKEMLSIMFIPSTYRDKFEKMMSLIVTACDRAELFVIHPEYNEEKILHIIQAAGYQPCKRVERPTKAIQLCSSDCLPGGFAGEMSEESAKAGGEQYRQVNDFMVRKQHLLPQFVKQGANQNDLRGMLIDYLAGGGSLSSLEAKDDSQLSDWLMRKWQARCDQPEISLQFKQAC